MKKRNHSSQKHKEPKIEKAAEAVSKASEEIVETVSETEETVEEAVEAAEEKVEETVSETEETIEEEVPGEISEAFAEQVPEDSAEKVSDAVALALAKTGKEEPEETASEESAFEEEATEEKTSEEQSDAEEESEVDEKEDDDGSEDEDESYEEESDEDDESDKKDKKRKKKKYEEEEERELTPEEKEAAEEQKAKEKSSIFMFFDTLRFVAIGLLVGILLVVFVVQRNDVYGSSMEPTLQSGDAVFVQMITCYTGNFKRGDIVTIDAKGMDGYSHEENLIKRIIGLPGETIKIEDGYVYINGQLLDESDYLPADTMTYVRAEGIAKGYNEITLGPDEYYCMGDNRGASNDSRLIGPFKKSQLESKVMMRIYPFNKIKFC